MVEFSWKRYIAAGIITLFIFALGLSLGLIIEGQRTYYVESMYEEHEVELSSSQLQYKYLLGLKEDLPCSVLYSSLEKNLVELEKTRVKLVNYEKDSKINDERFGLLKRKYTLEQINYWLLAKEVKDVCGHKGVSILYFYSDDEKCPMCEKQEFVLTYLKKYFGEKLLNFPIDEQLNEPMVDLLKQQYNITQYPTLIIEDEKFPAFTTKEKIVEKVCSYYGDIEECK